MIKKNTRGVANLVLVGGMALWSAAAASAWSAGQASRSVNDGVYSADQSKRGAATFDKICTMCHDTDRFTGDEFVKTWSGQPLNALFEVMSTTMPEDNPGSLDKQAYGDVLAFFLELNQYPPGAEELKATEEAMRAIAMEPRK